VERGVTIRVVVADDQPVICAGFAALLESQPDLEVVACAGDGVELVAAVEKHRPDVALVDVRMPVLDGIGATAQITGRFATKVLVLTTFDLDEYVFDAVKNGASGFLLKDVTAERLVEAVRLVADGSMLLGPAVSRRLVADFARRQGTPAVDLAATGLSAREREVLGLLARGRSNAEIAAELFIAVETVKSHVGEILRKLQLRDRIHAVVFAYENGLVIRGE
jgi:DNA-binding NarL/FixJ family response regulator